MSLKQTTRRITRESVKLELNKLDSEGKIDLSKLYNGLHFFNMMFAIISSSMGRSKFSLFLSANDIINSPKFISFNLFHFWKSSLSKYFFILKATPV